MSEDRTGLAVQAEVCANCEKLKSMHWAAGGTLYCSANPNSTREFKEKKDASNVQS